MLLGFIIGLVAGASIMCIVQINRECEERSKSFEEKYNDLIVEEKEKAPFTYDCLNDEEENTHIPRID
jgi:hypothetical protein